MRILLTGRGGQVGGELAHMLEGVAATDRAALDLADAEAIRRVIRDIKPEVIINAAAYNAVDRAESEQELALRVNSAAPGVMAEEARRLGALLVHYSTDYVFDGSKGSPYMEDDAPRPLSVYGNSKLEGEERVRASGCRHLILRTSWVYGPRAANFYQVIQRKAQAGEPMRMVDDQTSVPTSAVFVAEHTVALLRKGASGLLHVVPSGQATRQEFAREVVKALRSPSRVDAARTADFPAAARRPTYSVLDNRRLAALLGRPVPDWRALLERCMAEWRL